MATITNLQGSTQIGNSDEIINQNFQNINNAIVEKTGDQTIAGVKIFTAVDIGHDVTNNTESPYMRRAVKTTKVKNVGDAGGVHFTQYVDADNSIVGDRKRALRGYLKKWVDGVTASANELFSIEYDTYDGDATYTSRTSIKTDSLYFGSQNWTGAWTSYTPTRTSGITTSVFTVNSASYKYIGKTVFLQAYITLTASSTGSQIGISLPITTKTGKHFAGATWKSGDATSYGYADVLEFILLAPFTSGISYPIMLNVTYETN